MAKKPHVSTGRLARLAKLASLSAKLSGDVLSRGVSRLRGDADESLLGAGAAEKLVATLGDLKGLAMKLGQSMAMDPDLLSPEVRAVVARLQNQAPPMPFSTVRDVVAEQLGKSPEDAFARFETEPLAAASLGQVHRAMTHDGVPVAVKVQYPDIADALAADLNNLGSMVSVVASSTRMTQGREYFAELEAALLDELDYSLEAARRDRYAKAAAPLTDLVVPRVFGELSATKVLTLELLEGPTVKEVLERDALDAAQRFALSRLLVRACWGPFLLEGVIHADPHPGNFLVLPDGRLGVLDFGAIKALSRTWLDVNHQLIAWALHGGTYDVVAQSEAAGFVFEDREEARAFVDEVLEISISSVRSRDFDYATAGLNRRLRALFLKNALKLKRMKPPAEAMQFFRGVAGMSQNLENLKARGDFFAVFEELERLSRR